MTKHLLTALIFAGFSVAAKAEPTVYYCEMQEFIDLMPDGEVVRYELQRFTMKVDEIKVSFGGDGYMKGWSTLVLREELLGPDFDAFSHERDGTTMRFSNNVLRYTWHAPSGEIKAFVARCGKF